uniref:Uncharacterized protein n=1 Tax=Oryza sativa subsp. japonica TaxID=39947 RepID=Q6K742_ORYSJ|nr:hypothetical protein [Oryza sativa Japonica Group]
MAKEEDKPQRALLCHVREKGVVCILRELAIFRLPCEKLWDEGCWLCCPRSMLEVTVEVELARGGGGLKRILGPNCLIPTSADNKDKFVSPSHAR